MQATKRIGLVALTAAVLLLLGLFVAYNPPAFTEHDHHGSPASAGFDTSYLTNSPSVNDSILQIRDMELDGYEARARGYNRENDRYYYVTDHDGKGGDCGQNYTGRSLEWHQADRGPMLAGWGEKSYH